MPPLSHHSGCAVTLILTFSVQFTGPVSARMRRRTLLLLLPLALSVAPSRPATAAGKQAFIREFLGEDFSLSRELDPSLRVQDNNNNVPQQKLTAHSPSPSSPSSAVSPSSQQQRVDEHEHDHKHRGRHYHRGVT